MGELGRIASMAALFVALLWVAAPGRIERRPVSVAGAALAARIDAERPQVALLGNSMLGEGVDAEALALASGVPVLAVVQPGSASAWWYLAMKNGVGASAHRVPLTVLFFRDHFLTEPTFRVKGSYRAAIDAMAEPDEPLLGRLAYGGSDETSARLLGEWRAGTLAAVKHGAARVLLGLAPDAADAALAHAFAAERLDPERAGRREQLAEATDAADTRDFAAAVKRSFLPEIVRLARQNGTRLVLVRVKRRRDAEQGPDPALARYSESLAGWLAERGVALVDFSHDERIRLEHFARGDHLSRDEGRRVFTRLLVDALAPYTRTLAGAPQGRSE